MRGTPKEFEASDARHTRTAMRLAKLTAGLVMAACLLSGQATGADRPDSAAELEKLGGQIRVLDKDLRFC